MTYCYLTFSLEHEARALTNLYLIQQRGNKKKNNKEEKVLERQLDNTALDAFPAVSISSRRLIRFLPRLDTLLSQNPSYR